MQDFQVHMFKALVNGRYCKVLFGSLAWMNLNSQSCEVVVSEAVGRWCLPTVRKIICTVIRTVNCR